MKRAMFHLFCLLSLLLCSASLLLWFRSYRTADYLAYCGERKEYGVISTIGKIVIYKESAIDPFRWKAPFGLQQASRSAPDSIAAYAMPQAPRQASWMGFGVMSGRNSQYQATARFVPHWAVSLLLAILPILWARRRFRKKSERGFELANRGTAKEN
jgi:hypothetical protein